MTHAAGGRARAGSCTPTPRTTDPRGVREDLLIASGAALATAAVAWATRPHLALDDAAISFRYAERLATGNGFTYNDGQSVIGASSGLHTLLIAAVRWMGLETPTAALVIGLAGTALCGSLVAVLARRLSGRLGALVAVAAFIAGPARWYATGGLETSTLLACCLAAVLARHAQRDRLAGAALGLALVAKLDAATVLVSIVAACLLVRRRWPWDTMLVTGLVAMPWYLWMAVAAGNPLPQSLRSKLLGRADAPGYQVDVTWALRRLRVWLPAAAAGATVALIGRGSSRARETRLTLVGWLVLGVGAASLLPLGAPYPWYTAPASAPIALLAGDAAAWVRANAPEHRERAPAVVAVAGMLVLSGLLAARSLVFELADGRSIGPAESQAQDFRRAGQFVASEHPDATVSTCFGWVAYAAPEATITDPCGINTEVEADDPAVQVRADPTGSTGPSPGWCTEAVFDGAARTQPGGLAVSVQVAC